MLVGVMIRVETGDKETVAWQGSERPWFNR